MNLITEDALITCPHGGIISNDPSQTLVTVDGRRLLVEPDPVGWSINACSFRNEAVGILPCKKTMRVLDGYSEFITVNGKAACLDTVTGKTTGTPPATHDYTVKSPGQSWIASDT